MNSKTSVPDLVIQIIVFIIGLFLLIYGLIITDLSVKIPETSLSVFLIPAGLLLLLYPFIKYLKIGEYFEFSSKIDSVKEKTEEIEKTNDEIKGLINSIYINNKQSQTITLYAPPTSDELKLEKEKIEKQSPFKEQLNKSNKGKKTQTSDENLLAIIKTRIGIENILNDIITNNCIEIKNKRTDRVARESFRILLKYYPDLRYLEKSLNDTISIVNEVVHGHFVEDDQITNAIDLGNELIKSLKDFKSYLDNAKK